MLRPRVQKLYFSHVNVVLGGGGGEKLFGKHIKIIPFKQKVEFFLGYLIIIILIIIIIIFK